MQFFLILVFAFFCIPNNFVYAQQSSWHINPSEHPRIYLHQDKVNFLKNRIRSRYEPYYTEWQEIKDQVDYLLKQSLPVYPSDPLFKDPDFEGKVRKYGLRLPNIAFAYLMTDDDKYLQGAKKYMNAIASYPAWGTDNDLAASELLRGMATGYDWLYSKLTEAEKIKYERAMSNHLKLLINAAEGTQKMWWATQYSNNHNTLNVSAIMAAAVATYEKNPDAPHAINLAIDNFTKVLDHLRTDGSTEEGASYWSYLAESTMRHFEIEKDITGTDRLASSDNFKNAVLYRLYASMPNFRNTIMIGDSEGSDYYEPSYILKKLASIFRHPVAQWLAAKILETKRKDNIHIYADWRELAWYNENVPLSDCSGMPLNHLFDDLGLYTSRSMWNNPDALLFVFKSGAPYGSSWKPGGYSGHVHPDEGQILLSAFGKDLIIDDGYMLKKLTLNHNVATFDDIGQAGEGSSWFKWDNVSKAKIIYSDINEPGGYEYLIGDLSGIYPKEIGLSKYDRHVVLIKKKALFVFDDITSTISRRIDWRLHLNPDGQFKIEDNRVSGLLKSSSVGLTIDDISTESHLLSLTPLKIKSTVSDSAYIFNSKTFKVTKSGQNARFMLLIRPVNGQFPSRLRVFRNNDTVSFILDDGTQVSINPVQKFVKIN